MMSRRQERRLRRAERKAAQKTARQSLSELPLSPSIVPPRSVPALSSDFGWRLRVWIRNLFWAVGGVLAISALGDSSFDGQAALGFGMFLGVIGLMVAPPRH
jgi:hypothetical protein